jgi:hypothetical protein
VSASFVAKHKLAWPIEEAEVEEVEEIEFDFVSQVCISLLLIGFYYIELVIVSMPFIVLFGHLVIWSFVIA